MGSSPWPLIAHIVDLSGAMRKGVHRTSSKGQVSQYR
jgi:hypothetical protein